MAELKEIALSNLRVDQQNPRLADPKPTNQPDTLRAMAMWDPPKLQALAQDIAQHRLDPSNLPIVFQDEPGSRFYVVIEGNRRLTAIRSLLNPSLIEKVVPAVVFRAIKAASPIFVAQKFDRVTCMVVGNRDEARHWIEVRHQGLQAGAGTVPWNSVQGARWAAQFGGKKKTLGLMVLEFLDKLGALDSETLEAIQDRFPLSTLDRLLAAPHVRKAVGVEKVKGEFVTQFPDAEVAKPLARMVGDIAHKRIKVSDVDNVPLMRTYLKKFSEDELPNPKSRLRTAHSLGTDKPASKKTRSSNAKASHDRQKLIPRDYHLNIAHPRCHDIYLELRALPVSPYRNAVAVLSRVFIELSVDVFISKHALMTAQQHDNSSLGQKMNSAANKLEADGKLSSKESQAVRRAAKSDSRLAPTIITMHGYVHNPNLVPLAADLNAEFQNLSSFFTALWS